MNVEQELYIKSIENLLIYMCSSYTVVLDELLELGNTEGNKAYMKVSTIQGTRNRIPIRQLGDLEFQLPQYGFEDILQEIIKKRK